jgi:DNA-binding CsgD family transcriptional regulator
MRAQGERAHRWDAIARPAAGEIDRDDSTGDGAGSCSLSRQERDALVSKFGFSPREVDVAECFVAGLSKPRTAEALGISENRVRRCAKRMCAKLAKLGVQYKSDMVERILLELARQGPYPPFEANRPPRPTT